MFASWVPSSTRDGTGVVLSQRPHIFDPATAKTAKPVACHHCRTQKVRCTGEPNGSGCKRCQSLGKKCTYPSSNSKSAITKSRRRGSEQTTGLQSPATSSGTFTSASLAPTIDVQQDWLADRPRQQPDGSLAHDEGQISDDLLDSMFMESCEETLSDNYTTQLEIEALMPSGTTSPCTPDSSRSLNPQQQAAFSTDNPSISAWMPHTQWHFTQAPKKECRGLQGSIGRDNQIDSGTAPNDVVPECQCLQGVVNLMDELETLTEVFPDSPCCSSVDGLLVPHREALRRAESMLACQSCTARMENMTILALLAGRLANLCRRIATQLSSIASGTTGPIGVVVGTYRLESVAEYVAVMRTLLRMELRRLLALVRNLRLAGKHVPSEAMGRRLDGCERSALALLDSLGRECSL